MAKKKRPIGYETPSMRIQEEYKEILEQLEKKKVDWEEIWKEHTLVPIDNFFKEIEDFGKKTTEAKKPTPGDHLKFTRLFLEGQHYMLEGRLFVIQTLVVKVGKELAECDVRIAAVEKELKNLRRGIK